MSGSGWMRGSSNSAPMERSAKARPTASSTGGQDGDLVLGLFGVPLDDIRVTKTLEARRDGDGSWRGRWLRAEQCPIVLRPQL